MTAEGRLTSVRVWYAMGGGGPVHRAQDEPHSNLSWCGSRTQFRHIIRDGTMDEVTCVRCLRRVKVGRPQAYKSR